MNVNLGINTTFIFDFISFSSTSRMFWFYMSITMLFDEASRMFGMLFCQVCRKTCHPIFGQVPSLVFFIYVLLKCRHSLYRQYQQDIDEVLMYLSSLQITHTCSWEVIRHIDTPKKYFQRLLHLGWKFFNGMLESVFYPSIMCYLIQDTECSIITALNL